MKTIYIVTSGTYSDYGIDGVCSTRKKAELLKNLANASTIEEWVLDSMPKHPRGKLLYGVSIDIDGRATAELENAKMGTKDIEPYGDGIQMYTRCFAKDSNHAIKIANEKRVQAIALGKWCVRTDW